MGRIITASFIGAFMEWYDFFIYGTASALVLNKLFFPQFNPLVGTILSFATFAIGFLARPIGGVIFGHFGDRVGRKKMLVYTILIIGVGTFLIGLLPTYHSIGIWAPVLLLTLRILQGIGLGGEYGGAALMAIEFAPRNKRGFWGSLPQAATSVGMLFATGAFDIASTLPKGEFNSLSEHVWEKQSLLMF